MRCVLTIAGSDSSGGAGIQADLKTMMAHGVYGMSAITALTAQNTMGVTAIMQTDPDFIKAQIDAIFNDIRPNAVKIGMVANEALIIAIADALRRHKADNIVVDPVMVATSGSSLMASGAANALREHLFEIAQVITPNLPEAQMLLGRTIDSTKDMEEAAQALAVECGGWVLLKGGHLSGSADDLLLSKSESHWYRAERVDNPNTHGTGCTLSSAIASNLALGMDVKRAVLNAKAYVTAALNAQMDLGKGSGPLNHAFAICGREWEK